MKNFLFTLLLLLSSVVFSSFSQENEANEYNSENEKYLKMQDSLLKMVDNFQNLTNSYQSDEQEFAVPKRNTKLLDEISSQIYTKEQLVQYLASLMKKFEAIPANKIHKNNVLKYYPTEKTKDYQIVAVIFWINGWTIESIYAFLKAAQNSDDCLALNNISAMLNISGYPHLSIPILKYLLKLYPKNKILLNNMGQAYYELGALEEAMVFLTGCTSFDKYNVQANNTIGHIEQSRGNIQQAVQAYSNSMTGGYNTSSAMNLERLQPDAPFQNVLLPEPTSYPPSDDNLPFSCPEPPLQPSAVLPYRAQMTAEADEWGRLNNEYKEELDKSMQEDARKMVQAMMSGGRVKSGASKLFEKGVMTIGLSYQSTLDQMQKLDKWHEDWKEEFTARKIDVTRNLCLDLSQEDCCRALTRLSAEFNIEAQGHFTNYCEKLWTNVKGHYNVVAYWMPYITSRGGVFNRDLYMARSMLIETAKKLCTESHLDLSNACEEFDEVAEVHKVLDFKEPKCKMYNIPLGVGSIEIGCDIFKASGAEGIAGELELNFATSQVTIGMGVGFEVNTGVFNVSQKDMAYIEINTDNMTVTDWGSKASGEITVGKILEPIGVNSLGLEGTVQTGYESGITYSGAGKVFDQTLFDGEVNIPK